VYVASSADDEPSVPAGSRVVITDILIHSIDSSSSNVNDILIDSTASSSVHASVLARRVKRSAAHAASSADDEFSVPASSRVIVILIHSIDSSSINVNVILITSIDSSSSSNASALARRVNRHAV